MVKKLRFKDAKVENDGEKNTEAYEESYMAKKKKKSGDAPVDDNAEAPERSQKGEQTKKRRPGNKRTSAMKSEKKRARLSAEEAAAAAEAMKSPKQKQFEQDQKYAEMRIFAKGLPADCDEKMVNKLFAKFGEIHSVKLLYDSHKKFRGHCFVTFQEADCAFAALDRDKKMFHGTELMVQKAAPRLTKEEDGNLNVFIGGLPRNAVADVVKKDFEACGKISKFNFVQDLKTGKCKGYAFVVYKNKAGVDAALKFNDTEYAGKKIVVKIAGVKCKVEPVEDAGQPKEKKTKRACKEQPVEEPAQQAAQPKGKKTKRACKEEPVEEAEQPKEKKTKRACKEELVEEAEQPKKKKKKTSEN